MKKYLLLLLAGLIICTLIISGCTEPTEEPSPTTTTTSAPTTPSPTENKYGGILKWSRPNPPSIFGDPMELVNAIDQTAAAPAYEFLIVPSEETAGDLSPQLATSWELAPDK